MRYELVPDTPCPHCEKPNTTLRIALQDHGFTKVSRRCTSCGGEWTHTWDRDWLADAKNKKLRAEIDRLQAENEQLRAALKPFAAEAEVYDPPEGDDAETAWFSLFTCGNLRDARKAWKGEP